MIESITTSRSGSAPPVQREETCSVSLARRIAAMLDRPTTELAAGQTWPRGWHFALMAADTPRAQLRSDGFPGLGVPLPDLGLPRLLLSSRSVTFHSDLAIGDTVQRRSGISEIAHKHRSSGPMALVTVRHDLLRSADSTPCVQETQTYVLLPAQTKPGEPTLPGHAEPLPPCAHHTTVVPDDTLLFQYSALGFNSHRIHWDRRHAQEVEGFADLVVNGGLSSLLLLDFLAQDLGASPQSFTVRHLLPLICNRPVTLTADPTAQGWHLRAYDDQHRLAVDMQVET
jgi:3-methylfumaryl-CoA hydratase